MELVTLAIIIALTIFGQNLLFQKMVFKKLDYSCQFSKNTVIEGETVNLIETLQNRKLLPVPWLKADIHSSRWLDFAETNSVVHQESRRVTSCFFLKSYQKTIRRWKVKCTKRGIFYIDNVTLVAGDLLQYGRESVPVHVGAELVVYPDIIDIDKVFTPIKLLQGDSIVNRWIIDDPFIVSGIRDYTAGDPMNRIHWQATAKNGKLMVKKNEFTSQLSVSVILNTQSIEHEYDSVVYSERIELGIKAAATILDSSQKSGMTARFATNGTISENKREAIITEDSSSNEHYGEILKILARLKMKNVIDFGVFLRESLNSLENTDIYLITSYVDKGILSYIKEARFMGNRIKILLLNSNIKDLDSNEDADIYFLSDN